MGEVGGKNDHKKRHIVVPDKAYHRLTIRQTIIVRIGINLILGNRLQNLL